MSLPQIAATLMTTELPSLQYAPPLPRHKRRSFRRMIALVLLLIAGIGIWQAWPWGWRQAQFWHWQRSCATYVAPADQIVVEEAAAWGGVTPPFLTAATAPAELTAMERLGVSQSTRPFGPVVYLHERQTPGGQRRLLVIRRVPPGQRQSWDAPLGFHVSQWRLRPLFLADLGMTSGYDPDPLPQQFDADASVVALRIFAGQTDPDDPTRFTIDFETAEGRFTLEGLLRDPKLPAVEPIVVWSVK